MLARTAGGNQPGGAGVVQNGAALAKADLWKRAGFIAHVFAFPRIPAACPECSGKAPALRRKSHKLTLADLHIQRRRSIWCALRQSRSLQKMKSKQPKKNDVFTRHVREKRLQRAEQLGAVKALLQAAEREIRTLIPTAPGGIAINGDPDGLETNGQSISQRAAVSLAEIAESARLIHAQAVKGRALVECEVNGEILAADGSGTERKFAAFVMDAESFTKGAKA